MPDGYSPSAPDGRRHADTAELMSCERCKSRKLKCDRQRPACQRCLKLHASCAYTGRRKPGFPAGQRHFLEDKIRMLEDEIRRTNAGTRKSADVSYPQPPAQNLGVTTAQCSTTLPAPPGEDIELPHVATLEKTRRVTKQQPPVDLLLSVTSLFFRHIFPWLPFLDVHRVYSDMGSMTSPPLLSYALFGVSIPHSYDSRLDQRSSDSFWTYCKRRILVEILEEPSLKSLEALTILILDLSGMTNGPQVWGVLSIAVKFSVQLKLVGQYAFRTSAEDHANKALNATEHLHRRRLFWAIYALDSYISITTGHPSDMDESLIRCSLPSRAATWKEPHGLLLNPIDEGTGWGADHEHSFLIATPTRIFSYQLELMDISRHVHAVHLKCYPLATESSAFHWTQDFLSCSAELVEWYQNFPPYLGLNFEKDRNFGIVSTPPPLVMLHAYYHALILHLHGLSAYPPDQSIHAQTSQHSSESRWRCTQSLAALSTIASELDTGLHDRLGWPFAWALWVGCRYVLARNRSESLSDMTAFYILLNSIKSSSRYWQIGGKYWRLLRQAAAALEAELEAPPEEQSGASVLVAVSDLRIPTSDLEDRWRPDPMVSIVTSSAVREPSGVALEGMSSSLAGSNEGQIGVLGDMMTENAFVISQLGSDSWFSSSLFGTSGYQE